MSPEPRRRRLRDLLFASYVLCCVGALTWPGYEWLGNRIEPYVLGIPFSLAWVAGWVILSFVALGIYHLTDRPRRPGG
jgi:TRAP-type C4-dicarboxylate transport system permease small subunit